MSQHDMNDRQRIREADRPLVRLLREHLPSSHVAWDYIHIETEEPEKKDLSV